MGKKFVKKHAGRGWKNTDVSSSQTVECDMQLPIKSPILTSSFTLFTSFLHLPPSKKVGIDISGLKFQHIDSNPLWKKSLKNSPVLRDQFLYEDMGRLWHPLSSAGERGMTSDEK